MLPWAIQGVDGKFTTTHGETGTPEHEAWLAMHARCRNDKNYVGRIHVCERWSGLDGYTNFLEDMGRKPSLDHSLDRFPDNDGHYEPHNCRWATRSEQGFNRRPMTAETRAKIAEIVRHRPVSAETRLNLSRALKGRQGKPANENQLRALAIARTLPKTDSQKAALWEVQHRPKTARQIAQVRSIQHASCIARMVRVQCIDTGEIFDSITIAAERLGLERTKISACIKGRRKSHGGLKFKAVE